MLAAGSYTVALTQYDNTVLGPNLSDGFSRAGQGNFTSAFGCTNGSFCDTSDIDPFNNRTNAWALDILQVEHAQLQDVPEPATLALCGAGFLMLVGYGWRRGKKAACKA